MNLSVLERLMVLGLLPKEGDYATLKILMNLRLSLSFTEAETKEWGIVGDKEAKQTTWETNGEADVPIGEKATGIIVDALRKLERDKKLPDQAMGVYEKFIPTTE